MKSKTLLGMNRTKLPT